MQTQLLESLTDIDADAWNGLAGDEYPFLRHEFLLALEQSGAVCEKTGWQTRHATLTDQAGLCAILPLYIKHHSRGEYVFDQQWANAYHHYGLAYYPKLLSAIPFTPCQGPRMALRTDADPGLALGQFTTAIEQLAGQHQLSSWHCLFPASQELKLLQKAPFSIREGVQFQWFNKNYRDFDSFLQTLNASKRKMIKRERRRVIEQGVNLQRLFGAEINEDHWQLFFGFYALTYLKKGSQPYLNLAFFRQIAATMPEQLILVLAYKEGQAVGAALSFIGKDTLYGRYWGCHEEYHSLHFEACYYQGIDYCIEQGLARFDSGAQGEHKIARGFEPVTTYSAHWLKDPQFANAIEDFLAREKAAVAAYKTEAASYLPFRHSPPD
jgi:predicted N-acyltransferase